MSEEFRPRRENGFLDDQGVDVPSPSHQSQPRWPFPHWTPGSSTRVGVHGHWLGLVAPRHLPTTQGGSSLYHKDRNVRPQCVTMCKKFLSDTDVMTLK